jgi:hypothetical protein
VVSFDSDRLMLVLSVPGLLTIGTVIGSPVGFILWVFTKASDKTLSRTYRSTIAILSLASGCLAVILVFSAIPRTSVAQLVLLLAIFVPGVTIGLFTGSNLQPGHELVRIGEAKLMLPRIFAVLTGLVLRFSVVQLFLASSIVVILALQSFVYEKPYPEQLDPRWIAAAFGHFALASITLFARVRFEVLAVLTTIANVPVIAGFWKFPNMPVELWYVLLGYLVAWAVFLLSRWSQTDVAVGVLKEEFRYYLID